MLARKNFVKKSNCYMSDLLRQCITQSLNLRSMIVCVLRVDS